MIGMKCELCGSKNIRVVDTKIRNNPNCSDMKIYHCNDCEVEFLHPYYSEEELKAFYNGEYRKLYNDDSFYRDEFIRNFYEEGLKNSKNRLNYARDIIQDTDDVLEVGCASGYFLYTIKSLVNSVCGSEWDKNNAEFGIKQGIDIKENPEDFNKRFDVIFLFHVLEHVENPKDFLENLKGLLKPRGRIFIEVPNTDDVLVSIYNIKAFRNHYYRSAHKWNFNKKSLLYLFEKLGLKYEFGYYQTYDLSNHITWMLDGKPKENGRYDRFFSKELNDLYKASLIENGVSDIIYAKCYISPICTNQAN